MSHLLIHLLGAQTPLIIIHLGDGHHVGMLLLIPWYAVVGISHPARSGLLMVKLTRRVSHTHLLRMRNEVIICL